MFVVTLSVLKSGGCDLSFQPLGGRTTMNCTRSRGTISGNSVTMNVKEGDVFSVAAAVACVIEKVAMR